MSIITPPLHSASSDLYHLIKSNDMGFAEFFCFYILARSRRERGVSVSIVFHLKIICFWNSLFVIALSYPPQFIFFTILKSDDNSFTIPGYFLAILFNSIKSLSRSYRPHFRLALVLTIFHLPFLNRSASQSWHTNTACQSFPGIFMLFGFVPSSIGGLL